MRIFANFSILLILAILLAQAGCKPEPDGAHSEPLPKAPNRPQELRFVEDYSEGIEMARQWDKPILLFFSASWCPFSRQMLQDTFRHPQILRLAKQFICIQVDIEKNPTVAQSLQVQSVPTVQILSSRAIPLTRLRGQISSEELASQMQETLHALASRPDRHPPLR